MLNGVDFFGTMLKLEPLAATTSSMFNPDRSGESLLTPGSSFVSSDDFDGLRFELGTNIKEFNLLLWY